MCILVVYVIGTLLLSHSRVFLWPCWFLSGGLLLVIYVRQIRKDSPIILENFCFWPFYYQFLIHRFVLLLFFFSIQVVLVVNRNKNIALGFVSPLLSSHIVALLCHRYLHGIIEIGFELEFGWVFRVV